ncbi:hypothetical protein KGF54_003469 [Candida jiufengensis]|uniref:uncharacterized protein n=1 Tax=Candida jiufengensis TaxID=497108 RepID=UPI002225018E|nr:uncharacterized protein KGF54_003469 [Candida jiufengensis]KAI5952602.1 hypothetical protein KGF54_003469 [Candida jiufengensis]
MSDYSSQTVAQLKEILKERGLSTEGKKADLVSRLIESDNSTTTTTSEQPKVEESITTTTEQPEQTTTSSENKEEESTLSENQSQRNEESEEKPKEEPKVLTAEERKQLAIELLQKKISRAEKFGDDSGVEQAKKDLKRVEKFGVELGTSLAREIGLVDNSLKDRKFNNNNHRGGFKGRFNKNRGFKNRR